MLSYLSIVSNEESEILAAVGGGALIKISTVPNVYVSSVRLEGEDANDPEAIADQEIEFESDESAPFEDDIDDEDELEDE